MNLPDRLEELVESTGTERYPTMHIAQTHAEIERLHAQFAPLACIYDDGDEARPGDPCIWCDRTKPVPVFKKVTGTARTYAAAYAMPCPAHDCAAPVQHRCVNVEGKPRNEPHKERVARAKQQSE